MSLESSIFGTLFPLFESLRLRSILNHGAVLLSMLVLSPRILSPHDRFRVLPFLSLSFLSLTVSSRAVNLHSLPMSKLPSRYTPNCPPVSAFAIDLPKLSSNLHFPPGREFSITKPSATFFEEPPALVSGQCCHGSLPWSTTALWSEPTTGTRQSCAFLFSRQPGLPPSFFDHSFQHSHLLRRVQIACSLRSFSNHASCDVLPNKNRFCRAIPTQLHFRGHSSCRFVLFWDGEPRHGGGAGARGA